MPGEAADLEAIRELLAKYCNLLDRGEHAAWVELFTDEARFEAYGEAFVGPQGLMEMATTAPAGLHLTGDPLLEVDGDVASVKQSFLFVDQETKDSRIGWYDDRVERTAQGWRFALRHSTFLTYKGPSERPTSRRSLDDVVSTLGRFDLLLAQGDFDSWSALFLDDAVLCCDDERFSTPEERARFARSHPKGTRLSSLPVFEGNLQTGRLGVTSSFVFFTSDDGSVQAGVQRDELAYRKGAWRFASRSIERSDGD